MLNQTAPSTVQSSASSGRSCLLPARTLVPLSTQFAIAQKHAARFFAQDVAANRDAARLEFADPVDRQRALVELGQFFDVGGASADQQFVDAGPERRAVALAAGLRTRCEHEALAVFIETRTLNAGLCEHVRHHLGVRDR